MRNLWCVFGIYVGIIIIDIIIIVVFCIIKPKHFWITVIGMSVIIIFLLAINTGYIKDLTQKRTTEVTAEYVRYISGGGEAPDIGTRKMVFVVGGEKVELYSSIFTKYYVKMEKGKRYKIVYFNNTKIIKSYELIE